MRCTSAVLAALVASASTFSILYPYRTSQHVSSNPSSSYFVKGDGHSSTQKFYNQKPHRDSSKVGSLEHEPKRDILIANPGQEAKELIREQNIQVRDVARFQRNTVIRSDTSTLSVAAKRSIRRYTEPPDWIIEAHGKKSWCLTEAPSAALMRVHNHMLAGEINKTSTVKSTRPSTNSTILIDVHVHVIQSNRLWKAGETYIDPEQVRQMVETLNTGFKNTGFTFIYNDDISYTKWSKWLQVHRGSEQERKMKALLHRGYYDSLNVYLTTIVPREDEGAIHGFATFPEIIPTTEELKYDGVVINSDYMYNADGECRLKGRRCSDLTIIHETGHWLGLLHTFQGGCHGPGDRIFDTPTEAQGSVGCIEIDSCPEEAVDNPTSQSGFDPIHNYMDYSTDACRNQFTPGQIIRMRNMWDLIRATREKLK